MVFDKDAVMSEKYREYHSSGNSLLLMSIDVTRTLIQMLPPAKNSFPFNSQH